MFTLMNNEFAFDVDLSTLDCGLNGALYFVAMDADGGTGKYSTNTAGAKYGTGYCDAQCARDLKFVGGKVSSPKPCSCRNVSKCLIVAAANCLLPRPTLKAGRRRPTMLMPVSVTWAAAAPRWTSGVTSSILSPAFRVALLTPHWLESNAHASAVTVHPCQNNKYHVCQSSGCGGTYSEDRFAGDCDPNGCDFNPYRMGVQDFYGKGKTVDTSSKFTYDTNPFSSAPFNHQTEMTEMHKQKGIKLTSSNLQRRHSVQIERSLPILRPGGEEDRHARDDRLRRLRQQAQ